MASWNPEQAATSRLLGRTFDGPSPDCARWRTAAAKNAYALLSKRRFAYAAAFFLLADRLKDAMSVCLHQLHDLQLAIAIARVYESVPAPGGRPAALNLGPNEAGPVLRVFLEEEALPIAARRGDRWLASCAFWMLRRRDLAVRALLTPVDVLLAEGLAGSGTATPMGGRGVAEKGSPDHPYNARLYLTDDPALVVLYKELRAKTLQTLRGASRIDGATEWGFVMHNARLYARMGCDLLGLDLVRNWEFLGRGAAQPKDTLAAAAAAAAAGSRAAGNINPAALLRRRTSLIVADLPVRKAWESDRREAATPGGSNSFASLDAEQRGVDTNGHGPKQKVDDGREKEVPKQNGGDRPKPPPTSFEEPDANSLLDSFGF